MGPTRTLLVALSLAAIPALAAERAAPAVAPGAGARPAQPERVVAQPQASSLPALQGLQRLRLNPARDCLERAQTGVPHRADGAR